MDKKVSEYIDKEVALIMIQEDKEKIWSEIQKPFVKFINWLDKNIKESMTKK